MKNLYTLHRLSYKFVRMYAIFGRNRNRPSIVTPLESELLESNWIDSEESIQVCLSVCLSAGPVL